MRDLYSDLYKSFEDKTYEVTTKRNPYDSCLVGFNKLSHFVAMKGVNFDQQTNCRFMLVGRAVNGWYSLPAESAEAFGKAAQSNFEADGFAWVKNINGKLMNDKEDYSLSSPFWNTAYEVWKSLHGEIDHPKWVDYIAWSNLYKIAPPHMDNPKIGMRNPQAEICQKILQKEIECYKPTHILFITGWDWFADSPKKNRDFSVLFSDFQFIDRNNKTNGVYVEGIGKYCGSWGEAKVIVSCRPEFRSGKAVSDQIIDKFVSMD